MNKTDTCVFFYKLEEKEEEIDDESSVNDGVAFDEDGAEELVEFLKMKEGKQLWSNEDISIRKVDIPSAKELDKLLRRVTAVWTCLSYLGPFFNTDIFDMEGVW